jgi:hypothetical protein
LKKRITNPPPADCKHRIRLRRIEVRYSIDLYLSKIVRAKRFHISSFDISCSIFDIQNQPSRRQKTAGLIEKETLILCYRRVGHRADQYRRARWPALLPQTCVSYERRRWPQASSQIEKETLILCYRRVGHRADQNRRARWPAPRHFCNKRFIRELTLMLRKFLIVGWAVPTLHQQHRTQPRVSSSDDIPISISRTSTSTTTSTTPREPPFEGLPSRASGSNDRI